MTKLYQIILRIVLPTVARRDKLVWTLESKGNYTVKYAIKASLVGMAILH